MLTLQGSRFLDHDGRWVLLRGVNLGGSSKLPISPSLQRDDDFSTHRSVSFVGRPFPLDEAAEHFGRLRHWGFNLLRFLVTWEAIEHAAPGVYDQDYLDYLEAIIAQAVNYGFYVIIDPHQDAWSRMTGGDGAPGWTLQAAGFNIAALDASEAAITLQARHPDYPPMVWTDNYSRLACATMFTLFYAGQWVAPDLQVDGVNIQEYLQSHFIGAIGQVANRIKDMPHVLGYGPMNEPGKGYIGLSSLGEWVGFHQKQVYVSPADSILLGAGFPRRVPTLHTVGMHSQVTGETLLNPGGVSAWQSPDHDIWFRQGIWDFDADGEALIVCDDYFDGIDFLRDGLIPFTQRYATAMRQIHPDAIIFVESTPTEAEQFAISTAELPRIVNSGHWYDEHMLFTQSFDGQTAINRRTLEIVTGREAMAALFRENIAELCTLSREKMGDVPTLIGEFGLMFNINNKRAYRDEDFSLHELALGMYYDALDANLAHSALWNYTADNNNAWGDGWNLEDLSIFSRDQQFNPYDLDSGGRAIKGFCRPYMQRAAGDVLEMRFDHTTAEFYAALDCPPHAPESVMFLPAHWYGEGVEIQVSSGYCDIPPKTQLLIWRDAAPGRQTITFTKA